MTRKINFVLCLLIGAIGALSGAVIFRAKDYRELLTVKEGNFTDIKEEKTHGNCPRDFYIEKNFIACANLESDSVVMLDKDFEVLSKTEVKSPISVILKGE